MTVKSNQKPLYRQIGCQFEGKRKIAFKVTDFEKCHGRQTRWELKAKEAPEHIKTNWPGSAWIRADSKCVTGCLAGALGVG